MENYERIGIMMLLIDLYDVAIVLNRDIYEYIIKGLQDDGFAAEVVCIVDDSKRIETDYSTGLKTWRITQNDEPVHIAKLYSRVADLCLDFKKEKIGG